MLSNNSQVSSLGLQSYTNWYGGLLRTLNLDTLERVRLRVRAPVARLQKLFSLISVMDRPPIPENQLGLEERKFLNRTETNYCRSSRPDNLIFLTFFFLISLFTCTEMIPSGLSYARRHRHQGINIQTLMAHAYPNHNCYSAVCIILKWARRENLDILYILVCILFHSRYGTCSNILTALWRSWMTNGTLATMPEWHRWNCLHSLSCLYSKASFADKNPAETHHQRETEHINKDKLRTRLRIIHTKRTKQRITHDHTHEEYQDQRQYK